MPLCNYRIGFCLPAFCLFCLFAEIYDLPKVAEAAQSSNIQIAESPTGERIAPVWQPLLMRLNADGLDPSKIAAYFAELGPSPTQSPMGRKISELYKRAFFPAPKTKKAPLYYKGVVNQNSAELCRQFIATHRSAFVRAESRYGVSPAIAAALLYVETRLGKVLGDLPENAFFTLASMAVSVQPENISEWLPRLNDYENHLDWIETTMRQRSDWAYKELRALLRQMIEDKRPANAYPGSIYGAIGLCQFMPSNIPLYGADGNADGRIDLFEVDDAVASLANYLAKHGWRPGLSRARQHRLLMSYNHSQTYANTILALSDLIREKRKASRPGEGA